MLIMKDEARNRFNCNEVRSCSKYLIMKETNALSYICGMWNIRQNFKFTLKIFSISV